MTSPGTVSAVVYSRDEADLLRDCLPRLAGFDEVLVCDMGSRDDTSAVAAEHGARVVPVPDAPVVEQVRQLGLDAATSDWVLFVDADEHLPAGFRAALQPVLDGPDDVAGVRLRYDNVAFGRLLEHSLRGSAKFALLRRGRAHYAEPALAHVPPVLDGRGIDAPESVPAIAHLNFRSVGQTTEKILRYAANNPGRFTRLDDPVALLRELLRSTVYSGVWRDGRAGFAVAALHTFGHLYGSLLEDERTGRLTQDVPRRRTRLLGAVEGVQRAAVGVRDGVRGAARGGSRGAR
ncbi:MAG: glycosyltransferase [Micrococcales bacterium]|uniref:glycosyltransferase n=1 Tax=Cellulomonas sp. P4 TaxID=3142533 RepID=UPI0019BECCA4|nr:glycosyltransferase [Micrococcales bacterium]